MTVNFKQYSYIAVDPCEFGAPLTDNDENELFCGRGPNRVECPEGSYCEIHPADIYAVCCACDLAICKHECKYGFKKDDRGCEICECAGG